MSKIFSKIGSIIIAITVGMLVIIAAILVLNISTERRLAIGLIEQRTSAPFYTLPDPIPEGKPGTLVQYQKVNSIFDGAKAWRVMYHSTDLNGVDILVTGTVIAPDGSAPEGGWPVVSWGHPTTGIVERCAPSRGIAPFDLIEGLRDFIDRGFAVVATDYSGMGVAGPNSFLIGKTEGYNVLDIARAAREIPQAKAGNKLVLWGHSQGGQAVLFAAQDAAEYAPDLDLKAVAVAAPATNLSDLLKADINDVSGVSIGSYAFESYSSVYASVPGTSLDTILTPQGVAQNKEMASLCLLGQNGQLHSLATPLIKNYLKADPGTLEPWATLLSENSPGGKKLTVPLLIAQGETDTLVRPYITAQFALHEQSIGTDVTYLPIPNTGHGMVALKALPHVFEWLGPHLR